MGRGDAQSQMEFSATREMKYCDWSIDDMRAADCKKLAEKPEGVFRQTKASPVRLTGDVCVKMMGSSFLLLLLQKSGIAAAVLDAAGNPA